MSLVQLANPPTDSTFVLSFQVIDNRTLRAVLKERLETTKGIEGIRFYQFSPTSIGAVGRDTIDIALGKDGVELLEVLTQFLRQRHEELNYPTPASKTPRPRTPPNTPPSVG